MKIKVGILGFVFLFTLHILLHHEKAFSALQKVNLGVYGAQVRDITAYNNSGTTEILIAIDSITGVYRWVSGSSSSWQAVTYPTIVGKASQIEANLAPGYENDIYTIITETSSGPQVYGNDSGGASGSWVGISTPITNPNILLGHSSGMHIGTFNGDIYRSTGGVTDSFDLIYSFGSGTEIPLFPYMMQIPFL